MLFSKLVKGKKGASLSLSLSQMGAKVAGFFLIPFFTSYLTTEDYGIISLFTVIVSTLGIVFNGGMASVVMRNYYDTLKWTSTSLFPTR